MEGYFWSSDGLFVDLMVGEPALPRSENWKIHDCEGFFTRKPFGKTDFSFFTKGEHGRIFIDLAPVRVFPNIPNTSCNMIPLYIL